MIPIHDLIEGHLTVSDLQRSMAFFGDTLGLKLAQVFPERKVAFYWIGGRGQSMLGLRTSHTTLVLPLTGTLPCGECDQRTRKNSWIYHPVDVEARKPDSSTY